MKAAFDQVDNPLFTYGTEMSMNACVGDNGGPYDLFDYGRGFFDGGHAIVRAAQEGSAAVDLLIYPAAFSYRHGIELLLKQLAQQIHLLLRTGASFKKHHKMIDLWNEVEGLNNSISPKLIDSAEVSRAGKLVGCFDAFDPTGQVFRYPEDIKGNRHLANHSIINVLILQECMKELQEILEAWHYQVADRLDWHREDNYE